jgi:hypothetical protein
MHVQQVMTIRIGVSDTQLDGYGSDFLSMGGTRIRHELREVHALVFSPTLGSPIGYSKLSYISIFNLAQ